MTQNIAWWTCFGGTFPPFHLSTFPPFHLSTFPPQNTFPPFHLSTFPPFHLSTFPPFHLIIAPIYYEGMVLICISLSGVGLPGVNLIIYKDDLRMMAQNPVAAKEGAMKYIAECVSLFVRLSSNRCLLFLDRMLVLGHPSPEGPRLPGMTQCVAWCECF